MENQAQRVEKLLEHSIDKVTSHPAFLNTVAVMLNVNSYRKIWLRRSMEAIWKDLELPARREHEKLLLSIEELTIRIKKLELELQASRTIHMEKADLKPSKTKTEKISNPQRPQPEILKNITPEVEYQ